MKMAFLVKLNVAMDEYGNQPRDTMVANTIIAALYKTYANPMREDAGITDVISVAPVEVNWMSPVLPEQEE